MEPIILSILYYSYVILLCELARQFTNRFVRSQDTRQIVIEFIGTIQICACLFENEFIARHYGLVGFFVALVIIIYVHMSTLQTAYANPCPLVECWIDGTVTLSFMLSRLAVQVVAGIVAFRVARLFWRFEISSDHSRNFANFFCTTDLQVPIIHGILYELFATFTDRVVSLMFKRRIYTTATLKLASGIVVAIITTVGLQLTGMYFNPVLAFSRSYGCKGTTIYDHSLVYWLGPITGWVIGSRFYRWMKRRIDV